MARPEAPPPAGDDLDALFEADTGMDDIFDTIRRHRAGEDDEIRVPQKEVQSGSKKRNDDAGDVDEEIKITKKRAPIAKLDDTR
jgi:replication fork protection complex subunit Csm3/Swi3